MNSGEDLKCAAQHCIPGNLFDGDVKVEIDLDSGIRDILDAFPFYIMLIDSRHHIVIANKALATIGFKPVEIEGQFCPSVIHGVVGHYPGCPLEEVMATGLGVEKEIYDERSTRWLTSAVYPTCFQTAEGLDIYLHLTHDTTDARRVSAENDRKFHEHTAIADILATSLAPLTLDVQLQMTLDRLLSLPWLAISRRGAIFVVDEPGILRMRAERDLTPFLCDACANVPFGHCLCGRAAASKEVVFADCLDDRHDITYAGIAPHGHYCVPILSGGEVLGVLNTYLEAGHRHERADVAFLTSVASLIAGLIRRRKAEEDLEKALKRVNTNLEATTQAIAMALEVRDPYTAGHQQRVTVLACAIAVELGLSSERIEVLRMAAYMHDIGKIQVPSEILSKPGHLSVNEFALIKIHSQVGYDILKNIDFTGPVAEIIYQHHEKMDGSGYPRGLSNGEILLESRILTVADIVEAVSSHRPYRPALGLDKAVEIVVAGRGTEFDCDVVDACVRLIQEKGFTFQGTSN